MRRMFALAFRRCYLLSRRRGCRQPWLNVGCRVIPTWSYFFHSPLGSQESRKLFEVDAASLSPNDFKRVKVPTMIHFANILSNFHKERKTFKSSRLVHPTWKQRARNSKTLLLKSKTFFLLFRVTRIAGGGVSLEFHTILTSDTPRERLVC